MSQKYQSINWCNSYHDVSVNNVHSVSWSIPSKKVFKQLFTLSVDIEKQTAFPHG